MSWLISRLPDADREQLTRLLALMGLFFLVICAIGILRPIKNAVALSGLGHAGFYQVYLVSAAVVFFVPLYNWVGDRVPWRRMISATAVMFAGVLLIFRAAYREGDVTFGLLFYGWYDLLAAVMVSQFFMATQLYFDARTAKRFYPLVIAGGALGATFGGLVTGLGAELLGVPNLILVAAVLIAVFGATAPLVTEEEATLETPGVSRKEEEKDASPLGDLARVFGDSHVRLITLSVLLMVLVKQLVDFQFNAISEQVFRTTAEISEFQGLFNAATQWLPLVVLAGLRPMLRRWGVAVVLFMLPVFMVGANLGLALSWSLAAAVIAKGGDATLRYAAERTAREILYVPVPEDLTMRAKGYIDVAVEKGVGKVLSALLIFGLLAVLDLRQIGWVAAGLALVSVALAREIHGEYMRSLVRSFREKAVSLSGVFASLGGASTLPVVQRALERGDPGEVAFALELLDKAEAEDIRTLSDELLGVMEHPVPEVRSHVFELMATAPGAFPSRRIEPFLTDESTRVREAAAGAWVAARRREIEEREEEGQEEEREGEGPEGRAPEEDPVRELLEREEPEVRRALLVAVSREGISAAGSGLLDGSYLEERWGTARDGPPDREARLDVALAAADVDDPGAAAAYLERLVADPDPEVASAAIRSAGRLGLDGLVDATVEALGSADTRSAAADALAARGPDAVDLLQRRLVDEDTPTTVRRHLPGVLARIHCQRSVDALLVSYVAPETDQLLDYRTLKALNKLRSSDGDLSFDEETVADIRDRELEAARRYRRAARTFDQLDEDGQALALVRRAVREAWDRRQEAVFRCLGLVHPPDEVYRCYLAVVHGRRRVRASAVEWLEGILDRRLFARLQPVLGAGPESGERGAGSPPDPASVLRQIGRDKDRWVTRCAIWAGAELGLDDLVSLTEGTGGDPVDAELRALSRRLDGAGRVDVKPHDPGEGAMDLVQKVLLLQNIDLLKETRSEQLALVASVAELVEAEPGAVLVRRGEPPDATFVVVDGTVELKRGETVLKEATDGTPFGTWALVDDEPSVVEARATEPTTLLRVGRRDFDHVLADNPELAQGLLQGLSRRVRELVQA